MKKSIKNIIGIIMVLTMVMSISIIAKAESECEVNESFSELVVKLFVLEFKRSAKEEGFEEYIETLDIVDRGNSFELRVSISDKYLIENPDEDVKSVVINVDNNRNIYYLAYDINDMIVDCDYDILDDYIDLVF